MYGVWTPEQVATAEEPLLARTPEGALMRRAAHGAAQVALRMLADPRRQVAGNAYQSWIDTYADPGYQAMARAAAARIDALGESHGGHARFALLSATFAEAARLEARFWQQGLDGL